MKPGVDLMNSCQAARSCAIVLMTFLCVLFSSSHLQGQWVKSLGWGAGRTEPRAFLKIPDNGYVATGTNATRFIFGWLWKLTDNGDVEWTRTVGWVKHLSLTSDQGFILSGDNFIKKLDSDGMGEWNLYSQSPWYMTFLATMEGQNGGYISIGRNSGDFASYILKFSSSGEREWIKKAWGQAFEIRTLLMDGFGGVTVVGHTSQPEREDRDICLLKLSDAGDIEWQKNYGGSGNEEIGHFLQTADGSYVLAGTTSSFGEGAHDIWVLKLFPGGDVEWQKTYGTAGYEKACHVESTMDGGFILGGRTVQSDIPDGLVLKLSGFGEIEWQIAFGDDDENLFEDGEEARFIRQKQDGSFLVMGTTDSLGIDPASPQFYPATHVLLLSLSAAGELPACRPVSTPNLRAGDSGAVVRAAEVLLEDSTITFESSEWNGSYIAPPRSQDICPQTKGAKIRR